MYRVDNTNGMKVIARKWQMVNRWKSDTFSYKMTDKLVFVDGKLLISQLKRSTFLIKLW